MFSWKNIVKFFNTPIKRYGLSGEEIIDTSPKISFFPGILFMLIGAVIAMTVAFFVFAFLTP